jgi:membrane protease YdiL (CAAX protease family)
MIIKKYQHPVLFYVLSTLLPWTCWFIAGHISHITPTSNTLVFAASSFAALGLISPNIVAFFLIFPDHELRRDLFGRIFNFKGVKVEYWLMACFFMMASILLAQLISLPFGYSASQFKLAESFSFTSGIFPVWFLLIAAPFLEELAWHSYGTDCLRSRFNLFSTSILFAVYWGIWHFPLSSIKNYYHSNLVESGLIYSVNFLVSIIPFVLIMNWLYYKSNRNIWVAVIFHITAGYFNEIFQTHPMSKVIQTVLLLVFSILLILKEKDFFFNIRYQPSAIGYQQKTGRR